MEPLAHAFYARPVLRVARDLLGCVVERSGVSGLVVETEAYHETEPACHAYVGKTARTQTLFGAPGFAYVYRSYGIHTMLNLVCEPEGSAAAVLIRALEPLTGLSLMRRRRGRPAEHDLCSGPGKLAQALAIAMSDDGTDLTVGPVLVYGRPAGWAPGPIAVGPRVGITKAADLPWRFAVAGHPDVSRPRPPVPEPALANARSG
jgi:DNA-3-methyladenine glycosylase